MKINVKVFVEFKDALEQQQIEEALRWYAVTCKHGEPSTPQTYAAVQAEHFIENCLDMNAAYLKGMENNNGCKAD